MANEYENWRAAWGMPGLMRRGQDEYIASNYLGSKSPLKQVVGEEYGETITPYLGAETPIPFPGETQYLEQGDFTDTSDPAFGYLQDYIGGTTRYPDPYQSGRIKTFNTYGQIPRLQQDDFYENFRDQTMADQGIGEIEGGSPVDEEHLQKMIDQEVFARENENKYNEIFNQDFTNPIQDQDFNLEWLEKEYPTDLPYDELDDLEAQNVIPTFETSEEQEEYLERVRNMSTIQDQGIPAADKWRNFLSKVTRQPYRAATRGAYNYSPAQLNKMNALGGYYSGPMRQYRKDMGRIGNMLKRRAQGKKIGEKNFEKLMTQYGGEGGLSRQDLNVIGQKAFSGPGQAFEARPSGTFTTPSGEKGYSGGRATGGYIRSGYSKGGRVGILSIL